SVHYGLFDNAYDEEGRVITLEFEDFYFVACYVPNSGEDLKRLDFRMEFEDKLLAYLSALDDKKPVVYCGDLNVAHNDIDLKNPSSNHHNAGFTDEERNKFSILIKDRFIDSYRYFHKDEVKYSWWSYRFNARKNNAGWRIDYFIISNRLVDKVTNTEIHNEIYGSDHCPVEIDIKL
ncbi:MAG: exodeoxyribonuclease III, partial [Bacilli bacterium]|nr:exodeoxyribonuclease III [Bacilli bacterium]